MVNMKYYDEHESYIERRKEGSKKRIEYLEEIDLWENKYLKSVIPENLKIETILEVGCGTGDLIGRFPTDIPESNRFGVDISNKNIEFAKRKYPEINFCVGTIYNLIFSKIKKDFDLIILSDILEHVKNDLELLIKSSEHAQFIVVNIPLEKCYSTRKRQYGVTDIAGHLRAYNLKDALSLINKADLKIVNSKKVSVINESFWQKRFTKFFFLDSNFKTAIGKKLPFYLYRVAKYSILPFLYPSNLFAFLEKRK